MPYRRRKRRRTRKRPFRKRRKRKRAFNGKVAVPRGILMKQPVVFMWETAASLDATDLAPAYTQYRGNSLYDPLYAIGGTQPRYFDQWGALYATYTVVGAEMTCEWIPTNPRLDGIPGLAFVALRDENQILTPSSNTQLDQKHMWSRVLQNDGKSVVSRHRYSMRKFYSLSRGSLIEEDNAWTASFSTNPSSQCIWTVGVQSLDGSANPQSYIVRTRIKYFAVLTSPKLNVPVS